MESRFPKNLLVYKKNGKCYVHDNIATSVAKIEKICLVLGVETLVSNDLSIFDSSQHESFDAIFFLTPTMRLLIMKH